MDKLTIILRTCDKMEKFSSQQQQVPRPFGTKKEIIKKCFDSLIKSIEFCSLMNVNIELRIVDDHSSKETKDYLTSKNSLKLWELEKTGNGESLEACYELAKDECEGSIFFIEDDYLFEESAIYECFMAQKDFSSMGPVVIHPVDYIDRYVKKYPSYICLGKNRHWRTIKHTTGTFLITKEILLDQWDNYMKFAKIGLVSGVSKDTSINKVYEKYYCFSPMPTLAEHYQENWTLSPYSKYKNA